MMSARLPLTIALALALGVLPSAAQPNPKLEAYKKEAAELVDKQAKLAQEMVDSVFSFGELGLPGD